MDSVSNLSLFDISGEDDSLLFDVPAASTNVFPCSPLQSLRPLPPQTEESVGGAVDSENPSSSSKDGANKENLNWSKPEPPKLSVEPQRMKRKKKGGGYNLRKSLAWDRAFFTEQGVLNPTELSMISGTATPSRTNAELDVIHEEDPDGTSLALQEIEENLFKQSSDGVPIKDRKIGARVGLSPKPGALAKDTLAHASLAKRKVLAVNDVAGNRAKRSACPRPVASSSVKAQSKESKISRIPGPKSNVSVSTTTARSATLSTGSSKKNQNAHPATSVQKYGVKGLSKNPRTVPRNPKFDLADKCSVTKTRTKQTGKHLDNSVSETHTPSRMYQPGTGANKVSEACLPQGLSDAGEKKQQTQFQTTKSSGLRMPSPSLGFFSQAKASGSHSQLQKSSNSCKPAESNIPKLRRLETISVNEARLPPAHRKRFEIVDGAAENCTKKLSVSDVKSEKSMQVDNKHIAGVEVECDSSGFEKISKQEMVDISQMASIEVECDSFGFEKISNQEKVENILEPVKVKTEEEGELHKSKNVSNMEDMVFPRHEKKLLSKNHTHEQLEKETNHSLDDKLYDGLSNGNQSLFLESRSVVYHSMQRTSIGKDNISNTVHNSMGQDQDEQIKLLTCDGLTCNESLVLQEKHGTSFKDGMHSGEFKEYNSVKTSLVNSSLGDFSETVLGGSIQEIPCKNTEQVNDGAGDFGKRGGDAQVHLMNGNLSVNCNDTAQSNLEAVNQQLQGEQLKTPNPIIEGEISSKKENESHVNICQLVHVTTLTSEGSPGKSIPEINCASEREPKKAEIEECQLPLDGQSGLILRKPVDEGHDQVIDSKAMHASTQAFELDRICEDCITVSATACCTMVNNVSPESRPFLENNIENLRFTSQLCPTVKADCDLEGNDMLINNRCNISELQFKDDGSSRDTSMHCDAQRDVPGNFEQQSSMFTYSETNEMLYEDESLVPNHDHLLDQREFSEVSADFIGRGAENSSGHIQHTLLAQSVQFDHTNKEIEESHIEDAQAQSFNENPVVHNCNNEQCLSVTNDQFSLVGDNNINEDSHPSEFQRPSAVVGVDSQHVNNMLHLDGDWLPANIAWSEESKEKKLFEGALDGCNIYTSEHNASDHHIHAMPQNKDGNLDVDERAELLQMDDAKEGSSDILPLVEVQLNDNVISAEFDSSIKENEDHFTEVVAWKPEEHCSLSENSKLPASDNPTLPARISQGSEVSSLNSKSFSYEAETNISEKDEFSNTDMQHQTKGGLYFAEDSSQIIHLNKSASKSEQEIPKLKPPPNVAPFSDEWLAAIEAAGEEILTIKSGAVQNSPPEKPQQEPGPWSPVRRKNQAIGPFDCTKHTNIPHSSSE